MAIRTNVGLYEEGAWYDAEDMWEYGQIIKYKVQIHMGVCFIRKSEKLNKLYDDCMDILKNYDKLHFKCHSESKDETTLALAMPMNDMRATQETPKSMGFLPCLTYVSPNILNHKLSFNTEWGTSIKDDGMVLHFATRNTKGPLYRFEVECLNKMLEHKDKGILFKIRYVVGTRKISIKLPYFLRNNMKRLRKTIGKIHVRLCRI